MPLVNPGFEDAGRAPGAASGWALSAVTSLEQIAGFGLAPERAQEDFERWAPALASIVDVSVALAFFDGLLEGIEDFENGWQNNPYARTFSEAVFATFLFGGSASEDFAVGWLTASYATSFNQLTAMAAVFDDETSVEDFENQWQANDTYVSSFSNVGSFAAEFGGMQSFEDFENAWPHALSL